MTLGARANALRSLLRTRGALPEASSPRGRTMVRSRWRGGGLSCTASLPGATDTSPTRLPGTPPTPERGMSCQHTTCRHGHQHSLSPAPTAQTSSPGAPRTNSRCRTVHTRFPYISATSHLVGVDLGTGHLMAPRVSAKRLARGLPQPVDSTVGPNARTADHDHTPTGACSHSRSLLTVWHVCVRTQRWWPPPMTSRSRVKRTMVTRAKLGTSTRVSRAGEAVGR